MWQIEDMIRANDFDISKIRRNIIDNFQIDDAQKHEMEEWYESLIDMMRREGITEAGHLQINHNVLNQLVQLHQALLKDPAFPEYTAEFYRTLPYIVELRGKAADHQVGEIETCFTALYGMLMLRLQQKELFRHKRKRLSRRFHDSYPPFHAISILTKRTNCSNTTIRLLPEKLLTFAPPQNLHGCACHANVTEIFLTNI